MARCGQCGNDGASVAGKLCRQCNKAYMREYRKTVLPLAIRQAYREGQEKALREVRVTLLHLGDQAMDGFRAAELVRQIGLD